MPDTPTPSRTSAGGRGIEYKFRHAIPPTHLLPLSLLSSSLAMAVHFRFLASKVFESVAVAGDAIPLRQLKDEIYNFKFRAALQKHRLKETFDFRVYDAESKDEIVGDQTRIWKHSRVIVKRVPAYVVSEVERERAVMQSDSVQQRSNPVNPSVDRNVEDGFGEDVFSASCVSSERSFGDSATSNVAPIKLLEMQKLGVVPANRDVRPKEVERPRVMHRRKVVRVVKNCDLNLENLAKPRLEGAEAPLQVEVPPELACFLCRGIMKDSVLIPCCCNSFCRKCITVAILEQKRCPKCGLSKCKDSDLLPNRHINDSIQRFLNNKGPVISDSISASSDASSEHGQPMSQSNKVVENHKPQIMAPRLPNVCEKRKMAPLCISLSGAKKPKKVAATASAF